MTNKNAHNKIDTTTRFKGTKEAKPNIDLLVAYPLSLGNIGVGCYCYRFNEAQSLTGAITGEQIQ